MDKSVGYQEGGGLLKKILGTLLGIAYVVGVVKAFGSGFIVGFASIFIPPIAIFMLFT